MPAKFDADFKWVCEHVQHAALLTSIADTLEWDERTGMPIGGSEYRATQVSTLRATVHKHLTAPEFGDKLLSLQNDLPSHPEVADPHHEIAATIRELARDWQRDVRLSVELVQKISEATVRGQQTWDMARKADSFDQFAPSLEKIIRLKTEAGQCLANGGDAYEALLDEYEPGASVAHLDTVFDQLAGPLVELVQRIQSATKQPDTDLLSRHFPIESQRRLNHMVAQSIGFDFTRGRLDETSHPFCTNLGPSDCRILTRYDANYLPMALYGTLHEAGHGIYEQGLRGEWYGLPPGSYASLGIHESQSRLWENQVGRSRPFCDWLLPKIKDHFPGVVDDVSTEAFHFAVNSVRPSLIRVEADEATYNLHVLIRFRLERALIRGELKVPDLPAAWNDSYEQNLGIRPSTAAQGVLQDVHWSAGLIGYFPTYTLGNLAAAQLFAAARENLADLDAQLQRGDFSPLRDWLRAQVHHHGRCYPGEQLIKNATGHELSAEPLLQSLRSRYQTLYSL